MFTHLLLELYQSHAEDKSLLSGVRSVAERRNAMCKDLKAGEDIDESRELKMSPSTRYIRREEQ